MSRNSSHEVLKVDTEKAKFPLLLSFNFVVNTPLPEEEPEDEGPEEEEDQLNQDQLPSAEQNNDVINVPAWALWWKKAKYSFL